MGIQDRARFWNATPEERTATLACDRYLAGPHQSFVRAVDVDAPAAVVFRWLCQLKAAPYGYDWIDSLGRRSPRRALLAWGDLIMMRKQLLTLKRLAEAQVEVEQDRQGSVSP